MNKAAHCFLLLLRYPVLICNMESENTGGRSSGKAETTGESEMIIEQNLILYLKNILKHRIVPIDFMDLRDLIEDAPQKLLYLFVEKKYPGSEFLTFLQKYPFIFKVNPDKTVQSADASFCLNDKMSESYDEVDNKDMEEYVSDQESD